MRPGLRRWVVPAALVVAAVLLLVPLPGRWRGGWVSVFLDLGHVPLFGALVLVMTRRDRSPLWPTLLTVALAGLAELLQPLTGRTADWLDFLRGTLGALAAAAAILAWRRRCRP